MIILDTNVISETMKPTPHPAVLAWLNEQVAETLFLTSVTLAELQFGIAAMPAGKRKNILEKFLEGQMVLFNNRILPFDVEAARHYAELAMTAKSAGKGFPLPDGYIAAIASAQGFIVSTRDVSAFEAAGLEVINPWSIQQDDLS